MASVLKEDDMYRTISITGKADRNFFDSGEILSGKEKILREQLSYLLLL